MAFPAVSEHHITAGAGIHLGDKLEVNIGGVYSPEANIKGGNASEQFFAAYETRMSQYSLDFGIAYTY